MNHQHCSDHSHVHDHDDQKPHTDPVCGMKAGEKIFHDHAGQMFYFCSMHCKDKFSASPEKYLSKEKKEVVIAGATYTCPMHPAWRWSQ